MTKPISAGLADLANRPHALYRFFDRADTLLYVGITADLSTRMSSHRREKPWSGQIANIKVDHFATRQEALAAEAAAIRNERPLYNDQHNARALAPVVVIQGEPCGEECTEDCRYHHEKTECFREDDLGVDVIDMIHRLGDQRGRFDVARLIAKKDASRPEDDREFPGRGEVRLVAELMLRDVLDDLRQIERAINDLLQHVDPVVREQVVASARREWTLAGLDTSNCRWDLLPDVLRQLGYHFTGRPQKLAAAE